MEVLNKPGDAKKLAKNAYNNGADSLSKCEGADYSEAKAILNVIEVNIAAWEKYPDTE